MKGTGITTFMRRLLALCNLVRFRCLSTLFGFDVANQFIRRVDRLSLQLILKRNGAVIGRNCDMETGLIFHNCSDYSNLTVGDDCHIGKDCFFDLRDRVVIGHRVTISMQAVIITHQDMGRAYAGRVYGKTQQAVHIANGAFLGARSVVLQGVAIAEGSVVAAGSVVIASNHPNELIGGAPARRLKEVDIK